MPDSYREPVRETIEANREPLQRLAEKVQRLRMELHEAATAERINEEQIRRKAAELGELMGELTVQRARVYAQIRRHLPPESLERFQRMGPRYGEHARPEGNQPGSRPGFGPDRPQAHDWQRDQERPRAHDELQPRSETDREFSRGSRPRSELREQPERRQEQPGRREEALRHHDREKDIEPRIVERKRENAGSEKRHEDIEPRRQPRIDDRDHAPASPKEKKDSERTGRNESGALHRGEHDERR